MINMIIISAIAKYVENEAFWSVKFSTNNTGDVKRVEFVSLLEYHELMQYKSLGVDRPEASPPAPQLSHL